MSRSTDAFKFAAPLFAYCVLIFSISALSSPPAPEYPFEWGDKINHALAYAIMMAFALRASHALRPRALRSRIIIALLFCLVYGGSDELHQLFVPGRDCDALDWVADAVGATAMALALPYVIRWRPLAVIAGERGRALEASSRTA